MGVTCQEVVRTAVRNCIWWPAWLVCNQVDGVGYHHETLGCQLKVDQGNETLWGNVIADASRVCPLWEQSGLWVKWGLVWEGQTSEEVNGKLSEAESSQYSTCSLCCLNNVSSWSSSGVNCTPEATAAEVWSIAQALDQLQGQKNPCVLPWTLCTCAPDCSDTSDALLSLVSLTGTSNSLSSSFPSVSSSLSVVPSSWHENLSESQKLDCLMTTIHQKNSSIHPSHSTKDLALQSLLRWKMIISLTNSLKLEECTF